MISSNTGQYLNELITEMRILSEGPFECKHARLLLSREISKVFSDMQKATTREEPRYEAGKYSAPYTPQPSNFNSSYSMLSPAAPSPLYHSFVTPIKPRLEEPEGDWQTPKDSDCVLQTKIYIPEAPSKLGGRSVKCNYIGRILGPSGMSARMIERQFDVTLLIRGAGSVRNTATEQTLKGKKGYEHLDEPLHVLLVARGRNKAACEDTLDKAAEHVESLLTPVHDEYKREQLVRYAIINGTYEERTKKKRLSEHVPEPPFR